MILCVSNRPQNSLLALIAPCPPSSTECAAGPNAPTHACRWSHIVYPPLLHLQVPSSVHQSASGIARCCGPRVCTSQSLDARGPARAAEPHHNSTRTRKMALERCDHLDECPPLALVRLPLRPRVELGRRSPRINSRPRKMMDDLLKRVTASGNCEVRMIRIHAPAWFSCC
jgi:hypothetical protein